MGKRLKGYLRHYRFPNSFILIPTITLKPPIGEKRKALSKGLPRERERDAIPRS
jgi:hypothetical protein